MKKSNIVKSGIYTFIFIAIILLVLKPYYYINDDIIIRDILSGRYSGTPDAHIYNIMYPFAYLLMLLYSNIPGVDFYGLLLYGLMFFCLFLIINRCLDLFQKYEIFVVAFIYIIFVCAFLCQSTYISFTFTGYTCASIGLFLLITSEKFCLSENKMVLSLLIISFCLRKETFMAVVPFFCSFALYKIFESENKMNVIKDILICGFVLGICCGTLLISHQCAYLADDWKEFLVFRDNRKAVHDYNGYPNYEKSKELYDNLGLSFYEYASVGTTGAGGVNLALDYSNDINTILSSVDKWNSEHLQRKSIFDFSNIKSYSLKTLSFLKNNQTAKYMSYVFVGISIILCCLLYNHQKLFMFFGMNILLYALEFLYLGSKGRITDAVIISQVSLGICILLGIFILYLVLQQRSNVEKVIKYKYFNVTMVGCVCIISVLFSIRIFNTINSVEKTFRLRSEMTENKIHYTSTRQEKSYFEPAFNIESDSFTLFREFDSRFNNIALLGGWNYSSPSYNEAVGLSESDHDTIENKILNDEKSFVISRTISIDNIINYFKWKYKENFTYEIVDIIYSDYTTFYVYDFSLI